MDYKKYIRFVKSGKKGDISLLLENKKAFRRAIRELAKPFCKKNVDKIAGIEARGFILAGGVAYLLNKGLIMIRKGGKLPMEVLHEDFVDYTGKNKSLEIHKDAIKKGERVLVIDDWFETGAQAKAAARMIEKMGGVVAGFSVLIDDTTKEAKKFISKYHYHHLISLK